MSKRREVSLVFVTRIGNDREDTDLRTIVWFLWIVYERFTHWTLDPDWDRLLVLSSNTLFFFWFTFVEGKDSFVST